MKQGGFVILSLIGISHVETVEQMSVSWNPLVA